MDVTPKALVLGYFEDLRHGRNAEAFGRFADDVEYWVAGREWKIGGTYDKQGLKRLLREQIMPVLDGGLRIEVTGVTAEGERVAVEMKSFGQNRDGLPYRNEYHLLYTVRGGKIIAVREYLDTLHGSLVLGN